MNPTLRNLLNQMEITWDGLMTVIEDKYTDILYTNSEFSSSSPNERDAFLCDAHKEICNTLEEMMVIKEAFNTLVESENTKDFEPICANRYNIDEFAQHVAKVRFEEFKRNNGKEQ